MSGQFSWACRMHAISEPIKNHMYSKAWMRPWNGMPPTYELLLKAGPTTDMSLGERRCDFTHATGHAIS